MRKRTANRKYQKLQPTTKLYNSLYGIIAILIVVIPEFIAEFTFSIFNSNTNNDLAIKAIIWHRLKELEIQRLKLQELRVLAMHLNLQCYGCDNKKELVKRLERMLHHKQR